MCTLHACVGQFSLDQHASQELLPRGLLPATVQLACEGSTTCCSLGTPCRRLSGFEDLALAGLTGFRLLPDLSSHLLTRQSGL